MKKKILVLVLAFAMILAFTACNNSDSDSSSGSGSDSGSGSASHTRATEPNTGCGGIVFAVPDGWTMTNTSPGESSTYTNPESEYELAAYIFNDESLKSYNEWMESQGEDPYESIQDYYDKICNLSDDEFKEKNLEHSAVTVCDTEGLYTKYTGGKEGFYELSTSWLYDDAVYQMFLYTDAAYDENGQMSDDAVALTDDEIAMYEEVVASIQPGEGTPYQKAALEENAKSIGSITYDIPEGYTATEAGGTFVSLQKDGSDITIQVSYTDEDNLSNIEFNGESPSSLQELYDEYSYEGMETTTIAGFEGHVDKWPSEDDKYHNVSASFLADDAVYDIYMGANAYDEEGNLIEDAESLSEDDLAVFDAFIASMKKK